MFPGVSSPKGSWGGVDVLCSPHPWRLGVFFVVCLTLGGWASSLLFSFSVVLIFVVCLLWSRSFRFVPCCGHDPCDHEPCCVQYPFRFVPFCVHEPCVHETCCVHDPFCFSDRNIGGWALSLSLLFPWFPVSMILVLVVLFKIGMV